MRPSATLATLLSLLAPLNALKVTVIGGTGFVGTRVCEALVAKGADVTSISKSGRAPTATADGTAPWASAVNWVALDLLSADEAAIDAAIGTAAPGSSIVSCLGVVDSNPDVLRRGNGEANVRAFAAAKRSGVKRSVYISVSSEVVSCEENWLPFARDEFSAYFAGKKQAEEAAADAVGGDATKLCILKPSFIYGGETFEVPLPGRFVAPRVSAGYGGAVEEILSLGPICAIADAAPGLIKVALRPPSSVDAVAAACASAALGELATGDATRRAVGTLDGTAAINEAAGAKPPTVVADAIGKVLDQIGDLTEEFFGEVNARIDGKK